MIEEEIDYIKLLSILKESFQEKQTETEDLFLIKITRKTNEIDEKINSFALKIEKKYNGEIKIKYEGMGYEKYNEKLEKIKEQRRRTVSKLIRAFRIKTENKILREIEKLKERREKELKKIEALYNRDVNEILDIIKGNEDSKRILEVYDREREELEARMDVLNDESNKKIDEVKDSYKEQFKSLENEKGKMKLELSIIKAEKSDKEKEIEDLQEEIKGFQTREVRNKELEEMKNKMKRKLKTLEMEKRSAEQGVKELEDQLEELKETESIEKNKIKTELKEKIDELEQEKRNTEHLSLEMAKQLEVLKNGVHLKEGEQDEFSPIFDTEENNIILQNNLANRWEYAKEEKQFLRLANLTKHLFYLNKKHKEIRDVMHKELRVRKTNEGAIPIYDKFQRNLDNGLNIEIRGYFKGLYPKLEMIPKERMSRNKNRPKIKRRSPFIQKAY